ncbi:uncharacterized protein N7484_005303 [Penicillium longicatenatum]|uniref:uncharacterized protein n=1 Tax=Penicillium longicatenatum TaxID=1561947 RepID=UPI0025490B3B|nr:uncharacterized protein N7484_005303 [Penicillium longicatenatum]KAJ5651580.1 hypothetical protein N7484_005303 [Penicillium longicatenatum]
MRIWCKSFWNGAALNARLQTIFTIQPCYCKKSPRITRLLLLHSDPNSRKTLLEDVTIRNRLLRQAVQASLQDVIALLVAHGADPNSRNTDGLSLLHLATKNGDREVVQQLLAYEEISINATDRQSCTALHIAAEYGCTSVAKCLLAKCGIDSNARDSYGRTAFHIAAEYSNKSITGLLLAYGAVDINAPDVSGATALCLAADAKHTAVALQILAEDHVDVNMASQTDRTALHHAARTGNILTACVLLANEDLDPNFGDYKARILAIQAFGLAKIGDAGFGLSGDPPSPTMPLFPLTFWNSLCEGLKQELIESSHASNCLPNA